MDKSLIGLLAAIGAATPIAANAAVTPEQATNALRVTSVAELLDPAPNALAVLATLDAEPATEADAAKGVQVAQWHHHHHHHRYWRHHHHHHHRYYYHHHHHHHRWGWCWRGGVYGPFCF